MAEITHHRIGTERTAERKELPNCYRNNSHFKCVKCLGVFPPSETIVFNVLVYMLTQLELCLVHTTEYQS